MSKHKQRTLRPSSRVILAIIGIVLIGSTVGYSAFKALIPANRSYPVLGASSNYFIKAIKSKDGSAFVLSSSKGAKKGFPLNYKPTISTSLGNLVTLHIINEDKEKHNLNLDEFNVHTKDLGYFDTQSITFVADKEGTFTFYSSLDPEMTGTLIIQ